MGGDEVWLPVAELELYLLRGVAAAMPEKLGQVIIDCKQVLCADLDFWFYDGFPAVESADSCNHMTQRPKKSLSKHVARCTSRLMM